MVSITNLHKPPLHIGSFLTVFTLAIYNSSTQIHYLTFVVHATSLIPMLINSGERKGRNFLTKLKEKTFVPKKLLKL